MWGFYVSVLISEFNLIQSVHNIKIGEHKLLTNGLANMTPKRLKTAGRRWKRMDTKVRLFDLTKLLNIENGKQKNAEKTCEHSIYHQKKFF